MLELPVAFGNSGEFSWQSSLQKIESNSQVGGLPLSVRAACSILALAVLCQLVRCCGGHEASRGAHRTRIRSAPAFGAFLPGSWSLIDVPEGRHVKEISAEMVGSAIYLFIIYLRLGLVGMLFS